MRVTSPMTTPRYFIFEPMSRPCTDSLKYVSIVILRLEPAAGADDQQHHDAGDDRADDEQAELEVVGLLAHRSRMRRARPLRPRGGRTGAPTGRSLSSRSTRGSPSAMMPLRALVEHDHAVGDREDARELVRDDHERDAEVVGQPPDQRVELGRGDRVEPGRRLVEEQDRRVERHRARDRRALLHAAGDLGRQVAGELLEPDELELHPRDQVDRVGGRGRCIPRAAGVTFSSSVIEPNSAPDWYITPILRRIARRASPSAAVTMSSPSISTRPASGGVEADHVLQQRALAAARAAEDHEHLAAAARRS